MSLLFRELKLILEYESNHCVLTFRVCRIFYGCWACSLCSRVEWCWCKMYMLRELVIANFTCKLCLSQWFSLLFAERMPQYTKHHSFSIQYQVENRQYVPAENLQPLRSSNWIYMWAGTRISCYIFSLQTNINLIKNKKVCSSQTRKLDWKINEKIMY